MIHKNYLTSKSIITGKTGRHYNRFEVTGIKLLNLIALGYTHYYIKELDFFGTRVLIKPIGTIVKNNKQYIVGVNTINMVYHLDPIFLIKALDEK